MDKKLVLYSHRIFHSVMVEETRIVITFKEQRNSNWEKATSGIDTIVLCFLTLPRKCTGHSKHPLPTTQEKTLHMDITNWSIPKSDCLYSLQPKMQKLYTVSKNKIGS